MAVRLRIVTASNLLPTATITATIEAFRRTHSSMSKRHSSLSSVSTVEPAEARSEIGLLLVRRHDLPQGPAGTHQAVGVRDQRHDREVHPLQAGASGP